MVATREGGVDRNKPPSGGAKLAFRSPPARVAWIETPKTSPAARAVCRVATREGGVDRNRGVAISGSAGQWSPPARVAWIETGIIDK